MAEYYIGIMSGTSVDAIDAVLCDITSEETRYVCDVSEAIPESLAAQLQEAMRPSMPSLLAYKNLESSYSELVIKAVTRLLAKAHTIAGISANDVRSIGCHGQTLWHNPPSKSAANAPFSLQLINPAQIAVATGIDVISDFRQKDILVGGEGAPLVPAFHYHNFHHNLTAGSVILNLGGIANLTWLGADAAATRGFDCGPANTLIDGWYQHITGQPGFDRDGALAQQGQIIPALLKQLLNEPFFTQTPPKSTGRELFNLAWLTPYLTGKERPVDVLRTLVELTALTVRQAFQWLPNEPAQVICCGGGVNNPILMRALAKHAAPAQLTTTEQLGVHPQHIEAMAFAWLAWCYEHKKPGNLPAVTGADYPVILGSKTLAD